MKQKRKNTYHRQLTSNRIDRLQTLHRIFNLLTTFRPAHLVGKNNFRRERVYRTNIILGKTFFSKGIHLHTALTQSHRPEEAFLDSYDKYEPGFNNNNTAICSYARLKFTTCIKSAAFMTV